MGHQNPQSRFAEISNGRGAAAADEAPQRLRSKDVAGLCCLAGDGFM